MNSTMRLLIVCVFMGLFPFIVTAQARDATTYRPAAMVRVSSTPIGTITAWPKYSMPADGTWAECDGRNGTPDLRGRFIRGVGRNSVGLGSVQSEETKKHTHNVQKHSHTVSGTASSQQVSVGSQSVSGTAAGQRYGYNMTWISPSVSAPEVGWISAESGQNVYANSTVQYSTTDGGSISGRTAGGVYTTSGGNITGVTNLAGNNTDPTGGIETRPENVALKYIMKIR